MNRMIGFNGNEGEAVQPIRERIIYPLMCMSSMEPVRIRQNLLFNFNPLTFQLKNQVFTINFSAFKKEELGASHLTFIIASLASPLISPEFITASFIDPNSNEAKNFLQRPLGSFENFKKAILLFDNKPYSVKDFEVVIANWKKSLEEVIE